MARLLREIQLSDASRLEGDLSCMHDRPSQLNVYLSYLTRQEMSIKAYLASDLRFLIGWSLESEKALYGPPLPLAKDSATLSEQMKNCYRILQPSRDEGSRLGGVYVFLLNREWADSFDAIGARIFPTPDDDNYVYRSGDIGRMQGKCLKKHRENLRHFRRKFGDVEDRELDAGGVKDAEEVIRKWAQEKIFQLTQHPQRSPNFYRNLRDDHSSAVESLRSLEDIPLRGKIYYLNGEPIGYTSGLPLKENTFLVLNQKNLRLRGLSETVFHRFAESLMDQYEFLNDGCDAGIASLQFQKEHWRPCRMLNTFGAFLARKLLVSWMGTGGLDEPSPARH